MTCDDVTTGPEYVTCAQMKKLDLNAIIRVGFVFMWIEKEVLTEVRLQLCILVEISLKSPGGRDDGPQKFCVRRKFDLGHARAQQHHTL